MKTMKTILKAAGWGVCAAGLAWMCLCGRNGLAVLVYTLAIEALGCWLFDRADGIKEDAR